VTNLISFPFRLAGTGSIASRDDGDENYLAEELAQLVQTHPGERELVPTYGLNDPAFATFDKAMLIAQVATFGPPVSIQRVEVRTLSDEQQDVVIKFEPALDTLGPVYVGEIGATADTYDTYEEFNG
jgi:hypothetical protein